MLQNENIDFVSNSSTSTNLEIHVVKVIGINIMIEINEKYGPIIGDNENERN